jgi:adenosylhomocysteine nucleosidase
MTQACKLNLVVAHALEAKPLIEFFTLTQQLTAQPFPIYRNQRGLHLIVAGMGRQAAATATAYLGQSQADISGTVAGWLNVGIAGHQQLDIGEGVLAHKIIEKETAECFYPTQLFSGFTSSEVITVDEPELEYPENAAYEMEASGFYASVLRFVSAELAQVYKIISDNPLNPVKNIDASFVRESINGQCEQIQQLLSGLEDVVKQYNAAYQLPREYEQFASQLKLSASYRTQLKRLCQRYHALGRSAELRGLTKKTFTSARQLIAQLKLTLQRSESH